MDSNGKTGLVTSCGLGLVKRCVSCSGIVDTRIVWSRRAAFNADAYRKMQRSAVRLDAEGGHVDSNTFDKRCHFSQGAIHEE